MSTETVCGRRLAVRILAVETSTPAGGAALLEGDRLVGEYMVNIRATHSERLLAAVDQLLHDARWTPGDLNGLAVAVGPGSFTGLRIGISTVKGLALALGIPVAAVPTLEALAWGLPFAREPVCPILDAKKGEVYAALFHWEADRLVRDWEDSALAPEVLCRRLAGPVIFVGDGVFAYGALLQAELGPRAAFAPPCRRLPSPASVGQVGQARLLAGERTEPRALTPRYLRLSEAELRRRRGPAIHPN
ncbi:MAG: tRNA (adenosine(37)-N6)-threonylcarbamoyltransferase complex dimerization subunit type 1 TsaB [Candidatus Methylomirabilia bacterium]